MASVTISPYSSAFSFKEEKQRKLSLITVFNWNQIPPCPLDDRLNLDYILEGHHFAIFNCDIV